MESRQRNGWPSRFSAFYALLAVKQIVPCDLFIDRQRLQPVVLPDPWLLVKNGQLFRPRQHDFRPVAEEESPPLSDPGAPEGIGRTATPPKSTR